MPSAKPLSQDQLPWASWRLLNYTPNEWALDEVHTSSARFNTFCTCRQCGKSVTLSMLIHQAASRRPDAFGPPLVGVMTPDFNHTEMVMDKWEKRLAASGVPYKPNRADHTITLPWNGGSVVGMSAEQNPYASAGPTWSAFFVDEAQGVPDDVHDTFRPGLDIRRAPLFTFGTPDVILDQTWFEGHYLRGLMPDQPNYHAFTMSVLKNPWMSEESVQEAREGNMTEERFRMLYLGQWVQRANKVFRKEDVDGLRRVKPLLAPLPGHSYAAGLDLAQTHDYSVFYIMDIRTRDVVWWWRASRLLYTKVEQVVTEACKLFGVTSVMMENNGPGRPVKDHLRANGIAVFDVDLGNQNKGEIMEGLVSDVQKAGIGIPEDDRQLPAEMLAYGRKVTPSGRMGYSAPEGFFDDTVIALAYAAENCRANGVITVDSWATWGRGSLIESGRRIA